MEASSVGSVTCCSSIVACVVLSVAYVASLYIWSSRESRDHPKVIVRRFYSVFTVMCISPCLLYLCLDESILQKTSMARLLGLRWDGLLPAVALPLALTMILFLGPLSMQGLAGFWRLYAEPMYWIWNLRDLVFLRSHIVAPVAEEFVFRACMLPLLVQCYRPMTAVFIAPLFFGIAHLHHMVDRMRHEKLPFRHALVISCFQMMYTTMFGAYSAFLFLRTGHLAAPCVVHAFCNHMGFPDFSNIMTYKKPHQIMVSLMFMLGLVMWCFLLTPMTSPWLYNNDLFWNASL